MDTKKLRGTVLSTLLFILYIFGFLLTELTVNDRSSLLLGSKHTVLLYSVGLLCTTLGYISFSLSRMLVKGEYGRKLLIVVTAVCYMVCVLCFLFVVNVKVFIAMSLLSLLFFGYIGGFTHYVVALFLFDNPCAGRMIGSAVAVATLLQFVVQNLLVVDWALIISLIGSVAILVYLAVKPVKDWMFENPLPYAATPKITSKDLVLPICVVAVMSLCFGLGDGLVTTLDAGGTVQLTSWLRLVYAIGIFLAGVVADLEKRRFLPLCVLCLLLLFAVTSLFLGEGNASACNLYVIVMYLFSGFYIMYLTILFVDAAPMTEHATLWSGMGRIVRGPFVALTAVLSTSMQGWVGYHGIALISICLSLAVLILMLFDGQLTIHRERLQPSTNRMAEFVAAYRFTPREAEVFSLLLDNAAANKDIAGELLISLRVLERYITTIYEKTGVSKRIELMNLYYGKRAPTKVLFPSAEHMESPETSGVGIGPIPIEKCKAFSVKYGLTKRETELLEQVYLRKTNEDIAIALVISENTVKFHMKNLMKKLAVSSRAEIRALLDTDAI